MMEKLENTPARLSEHKGGRVCSRMEIGGIREAQKAKAIDQPEEPLCWELQGKCNVIRVNMIELMTDQVHSLQEFINAFNRQMREDLAEQYPKVAADQIPIPEALEKSGDQFVSIIDEWDAVFEANFMHSDDKENYLQFLKSLLKDRSYIQLAYMTGERPIFTYSTRAILNIFDEFLMLQGEVFYPISGMSEDETEDLVEKEGLNNPS